MYAQATVSCNLEPDTRVSLNTIRRGWRHERFEAPDCAPDMVLSIEPEPGPFPLLYLENPTRLASSVD